MDRCLLSSCFSRRRARAPVSKTFLYIQRKHENTDYVFFFIGPPRHASRRTRFDSRIEIEAIHDFLSGPRESHAAARGEGQHLEMRVLNQHLYGLGVSPGPDLLRWFIAFVPPCPPAPVAFHKHRAAPLHAARIFHRSSNSWSSRSVQGAFARSGADWGLRETSGDLLDNQIHRRCPLTIEIVSSMRSQLVRRTRFNSILTSPLTLNASDSITPRVGLIADSFLFSSQCPPRYELRLILHIYGVQDLSERRSHDPDEISKQQEFILIIEFINTGGVDRSWKLVGVVGLFTSLQFKGTRKT